MIDTRYQKLSETWNKLKEDTNFLVEAKKDFPNVNDSLLLEQKEVIKNLHKYSVSIKDLMNVYGVNYAKARAIKEAYDTVAIATIHAERETDPEIFNNKLNESCQALLEAEPEADWANTTLGPQHFKVRPGDNMPEKKPEETKKSFLLKVKDFLVNSGKVVVQVAKSGKTYKVLAIGATLVILGVIATSMGGWVAASFTTLKAVLGLVSVFNGSKELMNTKDFSAGKKGIEGVSNWIKNSKDPKNASKILLAIAQIALGAWGASSSVGQAIEQITTMDTMDQYNPRHLTKIAPTETSPSHADASPSHADASPSDVGNNTPPTHDLSKFSEYGANKARELQPTIQSIASSGNSQEFGKIMNDLGSKLGSLVNDNKLSQEQASEILKGFSKQLHSSNGSLDATSVYKHLMSIANLKNS